MGFIDEFKATVKDSISGVQGSVTSILDFKSQIEKIKIQAEPLVKSKPKPAVMTGAIAVSTEGGVKTNRPTEGTQPADTARKFSLPLLAAVAAGAFFFFRRKRS